MQRYFDSSWGGAHSTQAGTHAKNGVTPEQGQTGEGVRSSIYRLIL